MLTTITTFAAAATIAVIVAAFAGRSAPKRRPVRVRRMDRRF